MHWPPKQPGQKAQRPCTLQHRRFTLSQHAGCFTRYSCAASASVCLPGAAPCSIFVMPAVLQHWRQLGHDGGGVCTFCCKVQDVDACRLGCCLPAGCAAGGSLWCAGAAGGSLWCAGAAGCQCHHLRAHEQGVGGRVHQASMLLSEVAQWPVGMSAWESHQLPHVHQLPHAHRLCPGAIPCCNMYMYISCHMYKARALVPWCPGALVPWCPGALMPWCAGAIPRWCHPALQHVVPR
jgi:hypothetical protein